MLEIYNLENLLLFNRDYAINNAGSYEDIKIFQL